MADAGGRQYLRTHTLSGEHLLFDLREAEAELQGQLTDDHDRRGVTLVRESGMSVVLTSLRAGASLDEHAAAGATTVQVLSGHLELSVGDDRLDAREGTLVAFDAGVRHRVQALEPSTFLLTVSARPAAGETSA